MHHILAVDDSLETQFLIEKILSDDAQITFASRANEALSQIKQNSFDLILLDILLPDLDGFQVLSQLKEIKKNFNTPVLLLTGKGQIEDKELGFSLGAEDYIVKPFDPRELKARVKSKLKNPPLKMIHQDRMSVGPLHFHLSEMKAFLLEKNQKRDLLLTPNEFRLLLKMIHFENQVLSRQKLLNLIWGNQVHVTERTVDKHIYALRKKLGPIGSAILTHSGKGYSWELTSTPLK